MKNILGTLTIFLFTNSAGAAWSVATPKTALLKSFDSKCALFIEKKTNKALKVDKKALKGIQLKTGETEISYISPEELNHVCVQ